MAEQVRGRKTPLSAITIAKKVPNFASPLGRHATGSSEAHPKGFCDSRPLHLPLRGRDLGFALNQGSHRISDGRTRNWGLRVNLESCAVRFFSPTQSVGLFAWRQA